MVNQLVIVHKQMQTTSRGQSCCEATQNTTLSNENITELVTEIYSEFWNDKFQNIHSTLEVAHMVTCTYKMLHYINLFCIFYSHFFLHEMYEQIILKS